MNQEENARIVSREEHEKMAMIENLVWEAAKILTPSSYINPNKVIKAKNDLVETLMEK